MIGVDLIGQIRRAYFEQHRSIKEIVRTLSVSRATVQVQTTARYAHLAGEPIQSCCQSSGHDIGHRPYAEVV